MTVGIDPQVLFWSFLGGACSIWFGPPNIWMALGSVIVGTVFGTGFAMYAAHSIGVPPNTAALIVGFVGMIIGRIIQAAAAKWRPSLLSSSEKKT